MRKHTKILAALVAAAAVSGGAFVSAATKSSGEVPPGSAKQAPTDQLGAPVPVVQDEIRENFALFRNEAATPMPPDIAVQIGSSTRYGRNSALARTIATPYGTGWVTPGDGYLCIAVPDPVDGYGSSCVPTELAVARGLVLRLGGVGAKGAPFETADEAGETLDTMVLPDGAKAVAGSRTLSANANGVVSDRNRGGAGPMPKLTRAGG